MIFPKYEGKEATVAHWLDGRPAHWAERKIKYAVTLINKKIEAIDSSLEYTGLENIESWTGKRVSTSSTPEGLAIHYHAGDVLFGKLRPYLAKVLLTNKEGIASTEALVMRGDNIIVPGFLKYFILNKEFIELVNGASYGSKMPRANWNFIGNQYIFLPPLEEQSSIVNFLDYQCRKIDILIAMKKEFITKLQDQRKITITEAVTRGIDSKAPMVDTQVDWLGLVPKHWSMSKFKYEIGFQEGPGIMAVDFMDEGVPLIRIRNVQKEILDLKGCNYLEPLKVEKTWKHFKCQSGDLIISGSASTGLVSEVDGKSEGSIVYTGLIRLWPIGEITKNFIKWFVSSDTFFIQINRLKTGSTIQHFGPEHLRQMVICLPSLEEQEIITQHIERNVKRIDRMTLAVNDAINQLREYRSNLIGAAVTGQIDITSIDISKV
ncbi:restriction endonuclease subunit S [Vibrio lentus]|nr:restriction endonuclease subunit S [Vibrio lentus]PMI47041.1 hypothetical protein BCU43_23615 [Vibrio lentus]